MISFSPTRAYLSCLPVVGPYVSIYNCLEVDRESTLNFQMRVNHSKDLSKKVRNCYHEKHTQVGIETISQRFDPVEFNQRRNELLADKEAIAKKGEVYRKYAYVGINATAVVALAISLVALPIISLAAKAVIILLGCFALKCTFAHIKELPTSEMQLSLTNTSQDNLQIDG